MSANFLLEAGVGIDTGAAQQGGLLFGRQAWVGLAGTNWALTAGRQYSPLDVAFGTVETLYGLYWGNAVGASGHGLYNSVGASAGDGSPTSRVDNSLQASITFGPITAKLMYGLGNENTRKTGRLLNPSIAYEAGPVTLHASYLKQRQPAGMILANVRPETMTEWVVGGQYDFGPVRLSTGLYGFRGPRNRANLSAAATLGGAGASSFAYTWDDTRTAWIGASVPFGANRIGFTASRVTYDYGGVGDGRSTVLGVLFQHTMTRRTSLYASYGQVRNDSRANTRLTSTITGIAPNGFGADPRAFSMGMQHQF